MLQSSRFYEFYTLREGLQFEVDSPERHLLAEILLRAVKDLSPKVSGSARRSAICWFQVEEDDEFFLSFSAIAKYLYIPSDRVEWLISLSRDADRRDFTRIEEVLARL